MNLLYLNGIYQAKTESLLKDEDFRKLKEMSKKDFLEYLKNKGYGNYKENIEDIIAEEKLKTRIELNQMTNNNLIGDILFMNHDLNNIKIVIKSIDNNLPILLEDKVSKFNTDQLVQVFANDNFSLIKDEDHLIISKIKEVENNNIKEKIENIEQIYINYLIRKIKDTNFMSLKEYIDNVNFLRNVQNFLKMRTKNYSKEQYENIIINQDILSKNEFMYLIDKNDEEIINKFGIYNYGKLEEGIISFIKDNNYEKLKEDIQYTIDEKVQELSYNHDSIGPIINYIHFKNRELTNIRRLYYEKQ